METLANILQWGGAALVGLGAYIMVDRGRGEELWSKVFGITGFLAISADSLIDGARRSREGLCFNYDVDPETLETTATPCPTEPMTVGSFVSTLSRISQSTSCWLALRLAWPCWWHGLWQDADQATHADCLAARPPVIHVRHASALPLVWRPASSCLNNEIGLTLGQSLGQVTPGALRFRQSALGDSPYASTLARGMKYTYLHRPVTGYNRAS